MTIALLDGDIFAFEIASSAEEPINWGDGFWTLHAYESPAIFKLDDRIRKVVEDVGADEIIVCLSDDNHNFRKDILPSYKGNRDGTRKPMLLKVLKEHLQVEYDCRIFPSLEADDVLGILGTSEDMDEHTIIVTKDKDLLTVPGSHYQMHTEEHLEVSLEEADKRHLTQAIMGDPTDGYDGCPGVGATTAARLLEEPYRWVQYEHEFKSGKRKGETETRWMKEPTDDVWEAVVSHFHKAGLGEQEALTQARVARILRADDYDEWHEEPILWNP